jgi:enamine deaminase RidA (YjgF/YER057c/UK114 family)
MSLIEDRLAAAGFEVPTLPPPDANFVPVRRIGSLFYTAGQLPFVNGELMLTGRLGDGVSLEQGRECATVCALNILGELKALLGSLDMVDALVKLTVFVASDPSFTDQAAVADAASDLMVLAFGDSGRCTRSSVGVAVLPFDGPVEIEAVGEIADTSS